LHLGRPADDLETVLRSDLPLDRRGHGGNAEAAMRKALQQCAVVDAAHDVRVDVVPREPGIERRTQCRVRARARQERLLVQVRRKAPLHALYE
jgi:hypothetical protein